MQEETTLWFRYKQHTVQTKTVRDEKRLFPFRCTSRVKGYQA